jgi:hypothetical protein
MAEEKTGSFLASDDLDDRERLSATADFPKRKPDELPKLDVIWRLNLCLPKGLLGNLNAAIDIGAASFLNKHDGWLSAEASILRANP